MKQARLWLATIATLLCSLTASAHDFEVGGIYYNITSATDLTVEVTYQGSSYDEYSNEYTGAVTIPETVTYNGKTYRVTSIGECASSYCSSLTSITIPKSVTSIGGGAFQFSTSLTTFIIPEDSELTDICLYAFAGCSNLTSITIPKGVTSIGGYAFAGCKGLIDITIPNGVTSILTYTFVSCSGLTNITIPAGVKDIGSYAFASCTSLTSITLPESIASIGTSAFASCINITHITSLATTPPTIEYNTFDLSKTVPIYVPAASVSAYNSNYYWRLFENIQPIGVCGDNLTWKINPEGELRIEGEGKMYDYPQGDVPWRKSSVKTVVIAEGVTHIGERAFENSYSLTTITLPESVTSIGRLAIYDCFYLNEIHISNLEAWCNINFEDEVCHPLWYGAGNLYLNGELLTELTIPNTITEIKNYTFWGCSSLTSVTLPTNLTSIGEGAFYLCDNLTSINIPKSVTNIGKDAFYGCANLNSITVEEGNSVYDSRNDCNAIIETMSSTLLKGCSTTIIPKGVTSIGECAFSGCVDLTSIIIPEGVTSIGIFAFTWCDNLTEISIPASMTSIETRAFDNLYLGGLEVYCYVDNIPYMRDIFGNGEYLYKATLHVPASALQYYTTTYPWSKFGTIKEIVPTEVTITINQYGSATYCSPYALDFSAVEGLKAYAATGYNNITEVVTLTRVMTAQPGEGLFVKGEPSDYMVPIIESTGDNTLNMLAGTLESTTVNSTSGDGYYTNYKYTIKEDDNEPKFYKFEDNSTLSAGKAYLQIPTKWLPTTAEAKSISYRFEEGEGTTDMENSQFTIDNSQLTYDLYGRRVDNPVKGGIYIVGGRKVVY